MNKLKYSSFYNYFEKFTQNNFTKYIKKYVRNKNINVFDIGCYEGTFSKKIKTFFKNKKINFYLFDPNPNLKIKKFKINKIAISNKNGEELFLLNKYLPHSGSSLNSLVKNDALWNFSRNILFLKKSNYKKIKIKVQKLDKFCKKNKIKKIDILKIDTEGHEIKVLQGAIGILRKTNVVLVEILDTKKNYFKKFRKVNKMLIDLDFKLVISKNIKSVSILSGIKATDNLFVKEAK